MDRRRERDEGDHGMARDDRDDGRPLRISLTNTCTYHSRVVLRLAIDHSEVRVRRRRERRERQSLWQRLRKAGVEGRGRFCLEREVVQREVCTHSFHRKSALRRVVIARRRTCSMCVDRAVDEDLAPVYALAQVTDLLDSASDSLPDHFPLLVSLLGRELVSER